MDEGIEEILKKIEGETSREREVVIEQAGREAAEAVAAAEREAAALLKEARKNAETEAAKVMHRTRARLNLEERKIELGAREDLIQEVLGRIAERLPRLKEDPRYADWMVTLAMEALAAFPDEETLILEISPGERETLGQSFLGSVSEEARKRLGRHVRLERRESGKNDRGILMRPPGGNVRFDNRMASRLERLRNDLRRCVYLTLFGEADR